MLIIHVGADEMDVEYGDDDDEDNESTVINGKITQNKKLELMCT